MILMATGTCLNPGVGQNLTTTPVQIDSPMTRYHLCSINTLIMEPFRFSYMYDTHVMYILRISHVSTCRVYIGVTVSVQHKAFRIIFHAIVHSPYLYVAPNGLFFLKNGN